MAKSKLICTTETAAIERTDDEGFLVVKKYSEGGTTWLEIFTEEEYKLQLESIEDIDKLAENLKRILTEKTRK